MLKARNYNIADTNLALMGTPVEREIKKAAAEDAPEWKGVGKVPGLEVFRIEKFHVVKWEEPGTFFAGDSYIVLHSHKQKGSDKLLQDVYFWLGAETTQDEAGTAAYKTTELDTLLGDIPVQHREVQEHESHEFCGLFKKHGGIRILDGGHESGFRSVKPEEYKPRLLWIKGRRNIRVTEVDRVPASLHEGDVHILDLGLEIFQWNGRGAGAMEKHKGAQLCRAIDDERKGAATITVLEDGEEDETDSHWTKFWETLGGKGPTNSEAVLDEEWEKEGEHVLYHFSDHDGEHEFTKDKTGDIRKSDLQSDRVAILDVHSEIFLWIGKNASDGERAYAMQHATEYLKSTGRPVWTPITRLLEGGENEVFEHYLAH